jgi:hypothetical protein
MNILTKEEALARFKNAMSTGSLSLLVGAGISKIPPSSTPLGNEIKDQLIELITADIRLRHHRSRIFDSKYYIQQIPELIFQPIYENIKEKIFTIYSTLSTTRFNDIHAYIASLSIQVGVPIYTTNFDELIEIAAGEKINIHHLHGKISKPESMVIRIYQIGRGVSKKDLCKFKEANKGRTLVVLGYSGNDKDIIHLLNNTDFKEIILLAKTIDDEWLIANLSRLKTRFLIFTRKI